MIVYEGRRIDECSVCARLIWPGEMTVDLAAGSAHYACWSDLQNVPSVVFSA